MFGKPAEKEPRWEWTKLEENEAGGGCIETEPKKYPSRGYK